MLRRIATALISVLIVASFSLASPLSASLPSPPPKPISEEEHNPKIESTLEELLNKRAEGLTAAQSFAEQQGAALENGLVRVIIEPQGSDVDRIDQPRLEFLGALVEVKSESLIRASIPLDRLKVIANEVRGISYIRLPYTVFPAGVHPESQGIELTGAKVLHQRGVKGQGVTVAIIDVGFEGLSEAKNNGELPATIIKGSCSRDYTGTGLESGSAHGTAVAEIVYQMAPEAQLCLMKIANEGGLEKARDDAIAAGAKVINHSAIWFGTEFGDGAGIISQIADKARSQGILWVNAAGNHAEQHWEGSFRDENGNGWGEFSGDDETIDIHLEQGETVMIYLTWNDWPKSDQDYDLFLYDRQGERAASSQWVQRNDQPRERIYYRATSAGTYGIAVYAADAPARPDLEIFVHKYNGASPLNFEYPVPPGSIPAPGNATGVLTVAAINQANWETGRQEPFSSQGPTSDGRKKPDIAGPDGVSNSVYGSFYGTSAATPHVAGGAALLLSADPRLTVDQLRASLEGEALDMGAPGKDAIYGSGRLHLVAATCPVELIGDALYPSQDLDGDGLCEDVNGNGRDDFDDAVTLARNIDSDIIQDNWERFDFNGNARCDLDDAIKRARTVSTIGVRAAAMVKPWASLKDVITGSGITADPTITLGIFLDRLPRGLAGYRMTLSLPQTAIGMRILGAEFLAFDGAKTIEIAPNGRKVVLSATDLHQEVEAGAKSVELTRVSLKVQSKTMLSASSCSLRVDGLVLDDDSGFPVNKTKLLIELIGKATELKVTNVLLHPNPVRFGNTVQFKVEGKGISGIAASVYDLSGREIWASGLVPRNRLSWHLVNRRGKALANGVYLYIVAVKAYDGRVVRAGVRRLVILR